ncbi:hypothetical protein PE36_00045, partial [Moritella sp. PE36]
MAQQLSSVNVALNASTAQYVQALKKAQDQTDKQLKGMERSYKNLSKSVNKATSAISSAIAIGFSISGVSSFVSEMASASIEIERSAYAAGISASKFQSMAFAAQTVGISTEQLGSILGDTDEKI